MTDEERFARLEHRLETLEALVRRLLEQPPRSTPSTPPAPSVPPSPSVPAVASAPIAPPAPAVRSKRTVSAGSIEQWLGQRGLLAVGVVFVILAAGYLLKLSFDQGWISPLVRCVGGALVGAGIGALGWWLHGRGTRVYGAALLGAGAAIIYLAVWAAARLYQFLSPGPAVAALALVAVALAAVAWSIDVQALGATAALGAFFAPIVIGREAGSVNLLLLYLGAMGAGLGFVAARRHWRTAMFVIALAYFGIASSGVLTHAVAAGLYLYAILGGSAGLFVGLRERWVETRLLAFAGGWGVLGVADGATGIHWATLAGGLALTVPVWWRALRARTVWPGARGAVSPGDTFYFYLSPVLLTVVLAQVAPRLFEREAGLAPALVALPYLALGFSAVRLPFALAGVVGIGSAALLQWHGLPAVWALLVLVHLWALLDHLLARDDGRWYALATLAIALVLLVDRERIVRPQDQAAFVGAWALTCWWGIEALAALAAGLLRTSVTLPRPLPGLRTLLWSAAAILLLFGVTGELLRWFRLSGLEPAQVQLAGGLAVSAWWVLFAAGCFALGFRRRLQPLRLGGFAVAGLALGKVLFVDLATLSAFYRIGSALILGVVSLVVAYAYHRGARGPQR